MALAATLLTAVGRTTTFTSPDIDTLGFRAILVTLDMTTIGTGSVTVTINGKDVASGKYTLLLSGAAIVGNSTNRYKVTPGYIAAVANVSAIDVLPNVIQIVATANNANATTYTLGYDLIF